MNASESSIGRVLRSLTVVAVGVLVLGFVALLANSVAEVIGNPGSSIVDGYWRGRLPWIEFGVAPIVVGASAAAVLGLLGAWVTGGWIRRLVVVPPFLVVCFWWFLAMLPPMLGAPCNPQPCPPPPPDPWANAYSSPETAVVFLVIPSLVIALIALTAPRSSEHAITA
jgi:hypothetical protein